MIPEKISKSIKGKNVLVTGGTGLIGRQVVDILLASSANITSVSLDKIDISKKIKHVFGDLCDFTFCKKITEDIDFVFHLAGIKGSVKVTKEKPASFFVPILMMNTNVLEACRLNKAKKVVYTSSIGAYSSAEIFLESQEKNGFVGEPMDLFPGWAKRMAELQIKSYQIQYKLNNFAIVRPCNVYGPGDNFDPKSAMVIPSLINKIYQYVTGKKKNPVIIWGDGSTIRDFAYSRDVAEGIILAAYYSTDGQYVNLGSGRGYSIRELVETLASFLEFNYKFDKRKPPGFPKRVMDISLARKMIHWQPTTSLSDGLKETWTWFVVHQSEYLRKKDYFKG